MLLEIWIQRRCVLDFRSAHFIKVREIMPNNSNNTYVHNSGNNNNFNFRSARNFHLAQDFHLALLVGCNYSNNPKVPEENKLHGCINDANVMHALFRRFGFWDKNIMNLTDETEKKPTFHNIIDALNQLVDAAKPGDILLFFFSGGGALVNGSTPAIIPSDLIPITAADILPIFNRLPDKATIFFICDSSYSGGLFKEDVQVQSNIPDPGPNFRRKTIPSNLLGPSNVGQKSAAGISLNAKLLFSSSKANEESVEVYPNGDKSKAFGAFSSFIQTLSSPGGVNPCVLAFGILGFYQHPHVDHIDNGVAAPFLGNEA